jgi:putative membrane protein
MRWVHTAIVVLFAAGTLIFLVQNREIVSMDFLGFSVRAPLAVIAASFYLLGAITGGSAYALLRRSVQAASATAAPPPPRSV